MSIADATGTMTATQQPDFAAYLSLGWALVPLHDVKNGRCSCNAGIECSSAGKHPRLREWQLPNQLTRNTAILESWRRNGVDNFGVATGVPSGVWVLDVDERGNAAYREWGEKWGIGWTQTLAAQTGSGGLHLYFTLPTDGGAPITNVSKRKRRDGVLPPGIDVRGDGGQAVLPPSVSGKGAYVWLNWGTPILPAPAWLLALVREDEPGAGSEPAKPRNDAVGEPAPGPASSHGEVTSRGQAYAASAVAQLLAELTHAPVGTRNDEATRVARRLIELVNAPWSGLDYAEVYEQWYAAGAAHPDGVRVPNSELAGCWQRQVRHIGDRRAELPETWLQGEVIPFSSAPLAYGSPTGAAPVADGAETRSPTLRERLLSRSALATIPRPEWLIKSVLTKSSESWLIGASGEFKSFVAVDWACHVATGRDWNGKRTSAGKVLYVVAEGASGIQQRVQAWEMQNLDVGETVGDELTVLPVAVQAVGPEWRELCELVRDERPALIVLDTQARMSVGLEENSNTDMGRWVAAVTALKELSGACVLVVHHTGRGGGDARGASAIDAAQDWEWKVARVGGPKSLNARLSCDKSKDHEQGMVYQFEMIRHVVGWTDDGDEISSLVPRLVPRADEGLVLVRRESVHDEAELTGAKLDVIRVLRDVVAGDGATIPQIMKYVDEYRRKRAIEYGSPTPKPIARTTVASALERDSVKDPTRRGLVDIGLAVRVVSLVSGQPLQRYAEKEKHERWREQWLGGQPGTGEMPDMSW